MELAKDFKVSSKPVSCEEANSCADELERCLGEIMAGKRKPQNIPAEPMIALIQFVRDNAAEAKLTNIVRAFVEKQRISCSETIHQTDRVIENAYGLIEDLVDVVGYYRYPDDVKD